MAWQLFVVFMKVGVISFGGGYAVMTLIQREVSGRGWASAADFQEIVSLAGMAPGSIATNAATLIGFSEAGLAGAAAATAGIILPSLIIVVLLTVFFLRLQQNEWVRSSFYGLRPIVAGLILYAAVHFGFLGHSAQGFTWSTAGTLLICGGCLVLISKYKMHPFGVLLLSAVAGIVLF